MDDPNAHEPRSGHDVVTGNKIVYNYGSPTAAARRPAQVPRPTVELVGRDAELSHLDALRASASPGVLPLIVVSGMAGVGKSLLAQHWAHRISDQFPDGHLFVDLHGYTPGRSQPVGPLEALGGFLRALGVAPHDVPVDQPEATALLRTVLGERRMLILLDNARSTEQVDPLLPGSAGCLVVVTSRKNLLRPLRCVARGLVLGVLSPAGARALVAGRIGAWRLAEEPEAADELAELCAYLPLALSIAAAKLSRAPYRTIAESVTELRAGDPFRVLRIRGDKHLAVSAVFDQSYRELDRQARRFYRRLGLMPGPDITVPAAAAIDGTTDAVAEELLATLVDANLVQATGSGRYHLHDLLAVYARTKARLDNQRDEAVTRLLHWYLDRTRTATHVLEPHLLRLPGNRLPPGEPQATEPAKWWLDAELANLLAVIRYAADHGPAPVAWLLADALRGYFARRRPLREWLAAAADGLRAARADGDRLAQAAMHLSLSQAHWSGGQLEKAHDELRAALAHARAGRWRDAETAILNNLGILHQGWSRFREALGYYDQAQRSRHGTPSGTLADPDHARILGNVGRLYRAVGELSRAERCQRDVLRILDRAAESSARLEAMVNLSDVQHDLGDLPAALDTLTLVLPRARQISAHSIEAGCLNNLARVTRGLGRPAEAEQYARQALTVSSAHMARTYEAESLCMLAELSTDRGETGRAAELAGRSLALHQASRDRCGEVDALNVLGRVYAAMGRAAEAAEHYARGQRLARRVGYRHGEAVALAGTLDGTGAATTACASDVDLRWRAWQRAIARAHGAGARLLVERVRVGLAGEYLAAGNHAACIQICRQALLTYRDRPHRADEIRARVTLARVLELTGRDGEAREHRARISDLLAATEAGTWPFLPQLPDRLPAARPQPDRAEQAEQAEQDGQAGHPGHPERPERAQPERADQPEQPDQPERAGQQSGGERRTGRGWNLRARDRRLAGSTASRRPLWFSRLSRQAWFRHR